MALSKSTSSIDVLLLCAHESEQLHLPVALQCGDAVLMGRKRVAARIVGVGPVASAIGTMRSVNALQPKYVLLLGSCGAYPGANLNVGDVVIPSAFVLTDYGMVAGTSASVGSAPSVLEIDTSWLGNETAEQSVHSATTFGITIDDNAAAAIGRFSRCDVENMEGFAVGMACKEAGVAFAAIFGVTNAVGAQGRAEYAQHAQGAAHATASRAFAIIEKI